jgi:DNA-binding XRE family transcriptional regulator
MKRNELKVLRVRNNLTQPLMAERLGVSKSTYNLIEQGKRRGSAEFWLRLQKEFNLKDSEVWKLQNPQI